MKRLVKDLLVLVLVLVIVLVLVFDRDYRG